MKRNIAIIGYGRFGQLLAEILSPYGNIFVISSHSLDDRKARIIGYPDLKAMDWIIPSVPISSLESVLKKIRPFLEKGSLVMDVCSVKVYPAKLLKKHVPKEVEIIASHPMFGPDSAKNGLAGLQMVICPLRQSEKTLKEVETVFKKMKLRIITSTPEDHDRQAANNLALVHYIGRALEKTGVKKQSITTLGYERLLGINETVNNDTWQLFYDMQKYNPYAGSVRKKFRQSLEGLEKSIIKIKKAK